MHGHMRTIREETYLAVAEDFVRKFLECGGAAEAPAESALSSSLASGALRGAAPCCPLMCCARL